MLYVVIKARVKATGEFIEVVPSIHSKGSYDGNDGYTYTEESLIMLENEPDYWEKLKHQYAGIILAGMFANSEWEGTDETLMECAIDVATALVNRLKEESQCAIITNILYGYLLVWGMGGMTPVR